MKPSCPAWAPPLLAIHFLTRVPVPGITRLSDDAVRLGLVRAVAWFPLIGALIGTITAGTMLLAEQVWPRLVAVILALVIEARLTGAFHEDAVADFCDGLGGGRDPTHVRQIMKDSRIGSFGALGLALALALRAVLMYSLDAAHAAVAVIAAATFGRLLAVVTMIITPPISVPTNPSGTSSPSRSLGTGGLGEDVAGGIRIRDVTLAFVTSLPGLLPWAFGIPLASLYTFVAGLVFVLWFRALLLRRVGGSTGDCLGFAVYAGQLLLLMAATATLITTS